MEHSVPRIIPPSQCYLCGCQKFHKDERRVYTYQDYINNNALMVQVHRRRYRCANYGTKQWDQICGASTYSRKTYRFIFWEASLSRNEKKFIHKNISL
jgi:hypothetical protein